MNKLLLLLMGFSLVTLTATAQESDIIIGKKAKEGKGLYLNLQGGYLIEAFGDDLDTPFRTEIGDDDLLIEEDGRTSFKALQGTSGAGATATFGIGYMFSKHIGIELQANYLKTTEVLLAQTQTPDYQAFHKTDGWRVSASPLLVLSTGGEKVSLYNKTGLIVPLTGVINSTVSIQDQRGALAPLFLPLFDLSELGVPTELLAAFLADGTIKTNAAVDIEAETFGAFSVGFSSTMGLNYQISKNLGVYVEGNLISLSIKAAETTYKSSSVDFTITESTNPLLNPEALNMLLAESPLETPLYLSETTYVDELTENSNSQDTNPNFDPNQAAEELSFKNNYNAVGFQVGLKIQF